jgi:hypothetical protein
LRAGPILAGIAKWENHQSIELSSFRQFIQEKRCQTNSELLAFEMLSEVQKYTTQRVGEQTEALMISTPEVGRISLAKVFERILSQSLKIPRQNVAWFLERLEALRANQPTIRRVFRTDDLSRKVPPTNTRIEEAERSEEFQKQWIHHIPEIGDAICDASNLQDSPTHSASEFKHNSQAQMA